MNLNLFFFYCTEEKHPYYFFPLFKNLLTISTQKQCFLPSVQMKMVSQNKKKFVELIEKAIIKEKFIF